MVLASCFRRSSSERKNGFFGTEIVSTDETSSRDREQQNRSQACGMQSWRLLLTLPEPHVGIGKGGLIAQVQQGWKPERSVASRILPIDRASNFTM
jgi:hypothetical protein